MSEKKMIYEIHPKRKKEKGEIGVRVRVEAYDPCPIHAPTPCDCPKKCVGVVEKGDICLKQLAQVMQLNLFATGNTIKDTSGSTHVETSNSASSTIKIAAGTGITSPAWDDFKLAGPADTPGTAIIGAISGGGTNSTFNITGSVVAGASRAYSEIGLQVVINGHTYMVFRDTFTPLNVASSGQINVVYDIFFG